jgi:hypothetical protein
MLLYIIVLGVVKYLCVYMCVCVYVRSCVRYVRFWCYSKKYFFYLCECIYI